MPVRSPNLLLVNVFTCRIEERYVWRYIYYIVCDSQNIVKPGKWDLELPQTVHITSLVVEPTYVINVTQGVMGAVVDTALVVGMVDYLEHPPKGCTE